MRKLKNLNVFSVLTLLTLFCSLNLNAQSEVPDEESGSEMPLLPVFSVDINNSWECQENYHVTYIDFHLDLNDPDILLPDVIECKLKFIAYSASAMSVAYDEYNSFDNQLYHVSGQVCPDESGNVCFTLTKYISEESVTVMLTSSVPPGGNGSGGGTGNCNQLEIVDGSMTLGGSEVLANYLGSGIDCIFGFPIDCEPEQAPGDDTLKKGEGSGKPQPTYGPGHVSITPNPADQELVIETEFRGQVTVEIFTLNGLPVGTWKTERVDTSHLPEGLYVVKVSGGGQYHVRKIAVTH